MNPSSIFAAPEALHPSLWRASQLAHADTRCIDTGHATLSGQLPGGGWPGGTLVDLLLQQPGIGEMRLLRPALAACAARRIVLLQPPHPPQALALAALGLDPSQLLWLRSTRSADALWAAEQVLRSGSCGALLFWANHVRSDSLRRLHLAAQGGETLFAARRAAVPAPWFFTTATPCASGSACICPSYRSKSSAHAGAIAVATAAAPMAPLRQLLLRRLLVPMRLSAPMYLQVPTLLATPASWFWSKSG
jgi:protein ImuA